PSLPWAMAFPQAPDRGTLARHPSPLYQFIGEGVVLFIFLWLYSRQPRKTGQVSGMFLIGYGVVRFISEFFREPDDFLGLLALNLSMGQWLCIPMIGAGIAIWMWGRGRQPR
ncbi:MAG: prolipoprotein diacylglyceryl transferase family protein, partial [Burkholderiaceae bacterium]